MSIQGLDGGSPGGSRPEREPPADLETFVHDFNNLLMVINGHAELLTMRLGPTHPLHSLAQEVLTAAERATQLVQQLRGLQPGEATRVGPTEPRS